MTNELLECTEPALRDAFARAMERAKTDPRDSELLETTILNLAANDMNYLELLADNSKLLLQHSEAVFKVLVFAYRRATCAQTRAQVRALAQRVGFGPRLDKREINYASFTESQKAALKTLHAIAALTLDRNAAQDSEMRLTPLIVGPSGVGKTKLVRTLAAQLDLPVLRLAVGDWIVSGAARQETTYDVLLRYLEEHGSLILHLDELDKVTQKQEPTAWSMAVMTELLAMLDRRISYAGNSEQKWTAKHHALLT